MDFWGIEKQVTRGHAYFAERIIRTIKEAMLRRIAAGAGRRSQWHLMLADVLSQINGRKHATTQVAPNLADSDPEMAEIALRNIERRAKHKVTRPEIKVGDMVRIRVKPIESRGSYRVNETAWSEKVHRVVSAESGEMGASFGLEGWPEKVVHRDLRKVPSARTSAAASSSSISSWTARSRKLDALRASSRIPSTRRKSWKRCARSARLFAPRPRARS